MLCLILQKKQIHQVGQIFIVIVLMELFQIQFHPIKEIFAYYLISYFCLGYILQGLDAKTKEYVYNMIETLLPKAAFNPSVDKHLKMMEL